MRLGGLVRGTTRTTSPYVYHICEKRIKLSTPRLNPCNRAILCVNGQSIHIRNLVRPRGYNPAIDE
jgi:hypothetical protein